MQVVQGDWQVSGTGLTAARDPGSQPWGCPTALVCRHNDLNGKPCHRLCMRCALESSSEAISWAGGVEWRWEVGRVPSPPALHRREPKKRAFSKRYQIVGQEVESTHIYLLGTHYIPSTGRPSVAPQPTQDLACFLPYLLTLSTSLSPIPPYHTWDLLSCLLSLGPLCSRGNGA